MGSGRHILRAPLGTPHPHSDQADGKGERTSSASTQALTFLPGRGSSGQGRQSDAAQRRGSICRPECRWPTFANLPIDR
ncbi:hypothetical protein SGR_159 [Streptomyces griseus subsp. griseus NBRC 13350]|uniref:Uncharacterized protein n=1 Tax=Streptomyces griseus subsp. griseus (strain JCM 4626 / CBS 651.72 / NBRC 13350 / KCC S-0626 / ISP 5235) TaxID=455632 RepID=B1VNG5_STRGG|nr:hypothetical protein SGR_159 [Streptomyces griseus subsp. griseus NBRC 13350]